MIRVKIKIFTFIILLINLFLAPSAAFARGGRGSGRSRFFGGGSGGGSASGFQMNDPVMLLVIAIVIILIIFRLDIYRRKRKVNKKLKALEEEMHQRAYESWNLKNIEIRKSNKSHSNNGYLMCEDCKGYYMLESHEDTSDFDTCQCGGNLIYYNNIDEFLKDDLNTQKIS